MKRKIGVLISVLIILGGYYLLGLQYSHRPFRSTAPVVWQEFICQDGGFALQLPGIPTPIKRSDSLLLKLVYSKLAGFSLERPDLPALFYVYYADLPAVGLKDGDQVLETTLSVTRFTKKGKLESKKIELGKYPGREMIMPYLDERNRYVEISRIYLIENRFYQIAVVTPKNQASANYVTKYLDSFRLVKR